MSNLFAKFEDLERRHADMVESTGKDPLGMRIDQIISPVEAVIDGTHCLLLGTNNYLGLTFDEEAIKNACEALQQSGTGTTGSRVANGSYANHQDFERDIAAYYGRKHAMLFTTGYQANVGFLSAIAGKDDYILIDEDSHASIYDGCRMSHANILHFRHNDVADLSRRLGRLPAGVAKLVVVEGIYSMLGDKAPLKEIAAATKQHGAYLAVDEAHSLGVLGATGRGLAEEVGVEEHVDFILGTMSKSLGTIGGFCVSNHDGMRALRWTARSYLFTASLPPSVVASARTSLKRLAGDPALREQLWKNTKIFFNGLQELGYRVGPTIAPVIGIQMPDVATALTFWRALLSQGMYLNLALPPATPHQMSLLRCSLTAMHTEEQLKRALDVFANLKPLTEKAPLAKGA